MNRITKDLNSLVQESSNRNVHTEKRKQKKNTQLRYVGFKKIAEDPMTAVHNGRTVRLRRNEEASTVKRIFFVIRLFWPCNKKRLREFGD